MDIVTKAIKLKLDAVLGPKKDLFNIKDGMTLSKAQVAAICCTAHATAEKHPEADRNTFIYCAIMENNLGKNPKGLR